MHLIINIANNLHYDNLIKFLMNKTLENTDLLYISMNNRIIQQSKLINKLYINKRTFNNFSLKEILKKYFSLTIVIKLPISNNYKLKLNSKILYPTNFNLINLIIQEAQELNIDIHFILLYPLNRENKNQISNLNIKNLNKIAPIKIVYLQKALNKINNSLKKDFDNIVFEEIYNLIKIKKL